MVNAETATPSDVLEPLAAIDIGTNSIRLVIGQLLPDGQIEILEKAHRTVRLGQDSFRRSRLERVTMQTAVSILREFKRMLDLYKVRHVWTVATSALREARNADVFRDRVLMATGLSVDVIDGPQEGRLTVTAVRSTLNDKPPSLGAHTLICEVGGGGTMLTVLTRGQIVASHNLGLGSIRLQEMLGTGGQTSEPVAELIQNEINSTMASLEGLISLSAIRTVFVIGSDARFAAARVGRVLSNPRFSAIPRKAFDRLVDSIRPLSIEEVMSRYDLGYNDAETLAPALMIYQTLLHATSAGKLIAASVTMRDGLLLELARRSQQRDDPGFGREVIQSALSIAEKYKVNLHHAQRVAACAVRLFDELVREHGLGVRHRVLLEAAALLHEVGTFVASRAYHKHSYYLIANSEIYGLNHHEVQLVAHMARYHRRSAPKPTHLEYMSLPQESRIIVNKLAAILRLAKALDVSDIRQADQLKCRLDQDALTLFVPGLSNVSLRKRSLEIRSDMFEHVYGLRLEFEGV
jgi:exopolyphosphatase/guanosine-5'-triphosphate,3'-diphosphate pyrophosphatase